MKTEPWAIVLVIITTVLTSFGSLFYKFGADKLSFDITSIITNYYIIAGLIFYAIGAVLLVKAFKHGELSVLFPVVALSFVWVAILSMIFLSEIMTFTKWMGIIAIVAGVSFVGRGSE